MTLRVQSINISSFNCTHKYNENLSFNHTHFNLVSDKLHFVCKTIIFLVLLLNLLFLALFSSFSFLLHFSFSTVFSRSQFSDCLAKAALPIVTRRSRRVLSRFDGGAGNAKHKRKSWALYRRARR